VDKEEDINKVSSSFIQLIIWLKVR